MAEMLTLEAFEEASEKVREVTLETKLVESPHFSASTGNRVWLKPENMQRTGAYKVRGAYYKISTLSPEELGRGIVTASAGNHAQGVAFAATRAGARSVVVMPETTPLIKVERTKHYGAEVVLHGDVYDEACDEAMRLAEEEGYTFIHPFNDPQIIEGQATLGLDILNEACCDFHYVLLPIGGGGLMSGVGSVFKSLSPETCVVGVEASGAASMRAAFDKGEPVALPEIDNFADGIAVRKVGDVTFDICREVVDKLVAVPEGQICTTILRLYNESAMVVEPAGAVSVAALENIKDEIRGKNVVCVISGSNNDITRMEEIKERSQLHEGLQHYFIVRFPQRAGALREFLERVLGPDDDITFFEYSKKNSRERGPAVVGIELQRAGDYAPLIKRMKEHNIIYEYLNDKPDLFQFLI